MTRARFIELVKESQGALRRFLTALCCGDTSMADDLAQETFLRAYITIDDLSDILNFNAWLRRVAYNCFISYRRTVRHAEAIEIISHITDESHADDAFRYQGLYQALAKLTEKERTAVVMYYMEETPTREIAQIMETSENNVRHLLSRGRIHLKTLIKEQ